MTAAAAASGAVGGAYAPAAEPPQAKLRLILEGERQFAQFGIAGASLRDIALAAGHRNKSAAQYHFGGRDGLVRAILAYRRPQEDALREAFLAARGLSLEQANAATLVAAIVEPQLTGPHRAELEPYGRFLYALLHHDVTGALWREVSHAAPFTMRIYDALRAHCPPMADEEWTLRLRLFGRACVDLFANSVALVPAGLGENAQKLHAIAQVLAGMLGARSARDAGRMVR